MLGEMADAQHNDAELTSFVRNFVIPVGGGLLPVIVLYSMLSALGFGGKGIVAKSTASTLMALSAKTGVGGWVIAKLQSIGTAGLSWPTLFIMMISSGLIARRIMRVAFIAGIGAINGAIYLSLHQLQTSLQSPSWSPLGNIDSRSSSSGDCCSCTAGGVSCRLWSCRHRRWLSGCQIDVTSRDIRVWHDRCLSSSVGGSSRTFHYTGVGCRRHCGRRGA